MEWEDLVGDSTEGDTSGREAEEASRGGRLARLSAGLRRSRQALTAELSSSLFDQIDDETWERLEEALILADVGAPATADVVGRLEQEVEAGQVSGPEAIRGRLI